MPTAAEKKAQTPTKPGQYEVARPSGKCVVCGEDLPQGSKIMAALRETPLGFERIDTSLECWPKFDRKDVLAFWQTIIPTHEAKKKVFVDDAVLCELFERLTDTQEQAKVHFRFVLGLILMRKRMVIYETTEHRDGQDVWIVRMKGKEQKMDLLDPHLSEQQVTEVSQQLGQILNEEL